MCLEAAKSIPTGELLAYKLIARRKEDGVFVSPIQKSHVWNTNRVVVLDDSPEIWESSTDAKIGKGFIHTFSEEKPPMYQIPLEYIHNFLVNNGCMEEKDGELYVVYKEVEFNPNLK